MATRTTASEKILSVLDRAGSKALTTTQIASRSRVNEKTVRNLLPVLARKGKINYS